MQILSGPAATDDANLDFLDFVTHVAKLEAVVYR